MLKSFMIVCLLGVACADDGYNYPSVGIATPHAAGSGHIKSIAAVPQETQYHHHHAAPAPQHYEKHFYYFSAPEEHNDHQAKALPIAASTVKKNLQVIFIKPPENKIPQKAQQALASNTIEEQQTHIYILQKEPDYAGLKRKSQAVQQQTQQHYKPEVHFVQYRTPAEAHQAQQTITQQYAGDNSVEENQFAASNVNRAYLAPNAPNDKTYANKFSPSGVDVALGTSYIPPSYRH